MRSSAIAALVAAAVTGNATAAQDAPKASADMVDLKGKSVGQATFTQMTHGVRLRLDLNGLPPGWHGFHIHEAAFCEPPFASAGGHFNPGAEAHGYASDGLHAGDLPNVFVAEDGKVTVEFVAHQVALTDDQPTDVGLFNRAIGAVRDVADMRAHNILSGNGSSLIIHAGPDDYRTDPDGASGERIACGVIVRR